MMWSRVATRALIKAAGSLGFGFSSFSDGFGFICSVGSSVLSLASRPLATGHASLLPRPIAQGPHQVINGRTRRGSDVKPARGDAGEDARGIVEAKQLAEAKASVEMVA